MHAHGLEKQSKEVDVHVNLPCPFAWAHELAF